MPMGTDLNLDLRNIRLPELPGMGVQPGGMGTQPTFRQSSVGVQLPSLQTSALPDTTQSTMPFLPQEQAAPKRLELKTGKDGKVDWLATLISAGALAAGALTGNTRLAAAGSGFLQGRAQSLKDYDAKQERLAVREEAKAERDATTMRAEEEKRQRQTDQVQGDFDNAVARGEYDIAQDILTRMPTDRQANAKSVLESAKKTAQTDKAQKDKDILNKTIDGLIYNANTVQEAEAVKQYIQKSNLSESEKIERLAEADSQIERLTKANQVKNQESAFAAAKNAINVANSPEDVDTVLALEVNNPLLTEKERNVITSAAEAKKTGIQKREYLNIAKSLATADPEASARYYGLAGYPITADELRGKFLYREQSAYNRYLTNYRRDNPNATIKQAEAYANEMFENVYDKKYDPNAPEKSVEDKAGGQSAVSEVAKQQWVQGNFGAISEGKESLDQVFKELDRGVEKIEYLPNIETALEFKTALLDSLIANPSVPSITKKEARKKKALLIP